MGAYRQSFRRQLLSRIGISETGNASGRNRLLLAICLSLAALKLLLVSKEEIVARFLPHDDLNYILAAKRWYWFGHSFNYMMYIRQPVYSLWIALVHLTGVPLRIAIEIVFLLGAYCLVRAFLRAGLPPYLCAVCFAFVAFHPVSFQLFNWALSDTLYAAVLLMSVAASIAMWVERDTPRFRRYALLTGGALGLLWNIRPENVLLVAFLAFLGALSLVVRWRAREPGRKLLARSGAMVVVPALIILTITAAIAAANFFKLGLFVSSGFDAPGFAAAYKSLLRIRPSKSFHRVPVTTEARQLAYQVSPSFAQLKPVLEDRSAPDYKISASLGAPDQVIAGLSYWFLMEAAARTGHFQSETQANAFFAQIAREVNRGLADGRLPSRFVLVNFMDPAVSDYLAYLPGSLRQAAQLFVSTAEPPRDSDTPDIQTQQIFDEVANRRSAGIGSNLTIKGWAAPTSGKLNRILLRNTQGETLAMTDQFLARPDVAQFFAGRGLKVPADTGFILKPSRRVPLNTVTIVVVTDHGEYPVPLNNPNFATQGLFCHLDAVQVDAVPLQYKIETALWHVYGRTVLVLTCMALAGIIFLLLAAYKKRRLPEDFWVLIGLLLFVVLTRFGVFVLLDASSWPSLQERYFFPIMPIYSCCLLIVIEEALRLAAGWIRPITERNDSSVLIGAGASD